MSYILKKSDKAGKKYVVWNGKKKVYFGARGYEDYTMHKNLSRNILIKDILLGIEEKKIGGIPQLLDSGADGYYGTYLPCKQALKTLSTDST